MKGIKTVYICSECEYESPKWLGKCPRCASWNSFVEDVVQKETIAPSAQKRTSLIGSGNNKASRFGELSTPEYIRSSTGLDELDRVLGGGLVKGSVVLLSGEPGIGKSTLLLQICDRLGDSRSVLYVSGEESSGQLKLRAERLRVSGDNLYILTETNIENILAEAEKIKPDVIIADSVQTMYSDKINSAAGSITNVKEVAMAFISKAKNDGTSVILVGHINKEGSIAGPKVLEHMVDAVLTFEGDKKQIYRIIRANKNRYGSTNEIGVFEMTDTGLCEVSNPSEMLLADRPTDTSGNCAVCTMEGTRPIVAEIQALVTPTSFPAPRRTSNGIDYNRTYLILAVLEKRLGLRFSSNDVYLNVIGGLQINEPASDLGIALALISSLTDTVIPDSLIAIGELGLAGECRGVANVELRVKEAARLGFNKALIPAHNLKSTQKIDGIEVIPVKNVYDILRLLKKAATKEKKADEEQDI
ncbi:MAG: DNA repair protein RadA [Ruminococcaceae bacterium]|nr:DNA repair protein RadA [Oscillospiraceae bacterium]